MSVAELQRTIRGLSAKDRRAIAAIMVRMKQPAAATGRKPARFAKSKLSGMIVSKGAKGAPRVTSETVRALLADFP